MGNIVSWNKKVRHVAVGAQQFFYVKVETPSYGLSSRQQQQPQQQLRHADSNTNKWWLAYGLLHTISGS
jgi:hypothetical protein